MKPHPLIKASSLYNASSEGADLGTLVYVEGGVFCVQGGLFETALSAADPPFVPLSTLRQAPVMPGCLVFLGFRGGRLRILIDR